jgi:hypothetical protein
MTLKSGASAVKATSHSSTATHRAKQHRADDNFFRWGLIAPGITADPDLGPGKAKAIDSSNQ